jgi:hypothetical protein
MDHLSLPSVIAQLILEVINMLSIVQLHYSPRIGLTQHLSRAKASYLFQGWDGLSLSNAIGKYTLEGINSVSLIQLHNLAWKGSPQFP